MAIEAAPTVLPVFDELTKSRIETHLAEYNALTTRLTYWITLQYVTYAIAGAALGFLAEAWGHVDSRQLAWASILIQLCLLWALAQTNFEIFTYVVYIERHLRPKLKELITCNSFWRFERYLKALRRKRGVSYEQRFGLFPLFACGIAVALCVIVHSLRVERPLSISDGVWFGCTIYVVAVVILKFRYAVILQKRAIQSRVKPIGAPQKRPMMNISNPANGAEPGKP